MSRLRIPAAAAAACCALTAAADTITINPIKDNTLYESVVGEISNGSGTGMFAGTTIQDVERRAVFAFDVAAAVPEGHIVTSATVQLFMNQNIVGTINYSLHRLTADWGEGSSNSDPGPGMGGAGAQAEPGDATWQHTFYNDQFWATDGGDYEAAASASANVGMANTYYSWTSPQLAADVNAWLADPCSNFGWILRTAAAPPSAKRFATREGSVNQRPRLVLITQPGPPPTVCPADLNASGAVDSTDLNIVLAGFGCANASCATGPCSGDIDGDGDTDSEDLNILLAAFGQLCPAP